MCCNIWFQCFLNTCQLRADASADSGQPPHSGLLLLIWINNQRYIAYFLVTIPSNNPEGPPPHPGSLGQVSCCEPGSAAVSKTTHPPNAKVGFECKLLFILNNIFLLSINAYLCKSLSRHFCKYLQILADSDDSEWPAAPVSKSNPI